MGRLGGLRVGLTGVSAEVSRPNVAQTQKHRWTTVLPLRR